MPGAVPLIGSVFTDIEGQFGDEGRIGKRCNCVNSPA
jgi:hypothetical protein